MLADLMDFIALRYPDLLAASGQHLAISFMAVILGILAAVPLGIYLSEKPNKPLHSVIFGIANLFQTIPSLALLAILIPLMGIGVKPAVFALFLYSLLPILRNTYAGFQSVSPSVTEAAKGVGCGTLQRLLLIQLPIAFPYIMSGIRLTTVYIISWTTLAALIGAGGLGQLIISGIGVNREELVISASVLAILLALMADWVLGAIERRFSRRTGSSRAPTLVSS
jgi:osmoprotectant transport system permease protein